VQATSTSITPKGTAIDAAGNLFIADMWNLRIRKVDPTGVISTVAGIGSSADSGDGGPATAAGVNGDGVAVDGNGNLFISEQGNSRVRKVAPNGIITTIAGTGTPGYNGDGIAATLAQLNNPVGVAADPVGNVFIADLGNRRVRKVSPEGVISTIAGNGTLGFSGDGAQGTLATMRGPDGVTVDAAGNVYFSDGDGLGTSSGSNNRVRRIATDGVIDTVAGDGSTGAVGDGGLAISGGLANPIGLSFDASGNLLVSDANNLRIRKVSPTGFISTVAGSGSTLVFGDGGPATSAALNLPAGTAVDAAGNLYIADAGGQRIRKVTTDGVIHTLAGNGSVGFSGDGGQSIFAKLFSPDGVAVDASGNLYIADYGNHRLRKVTPAGVISSINLSGLSNPAQLAFDGSGRLLVADYGTNVVRRGVPEGTFSIIAGIVTAGFSGDGGLAKNAALSRPIGVAADPDGNVYIADTGNNRIRKVTPTGVISTVAGNGTVGFSGDGGIATSATLASPEGLAVDAVGNLYISDTNNSRIRKVDLATVAGFSPSALLRGDFDGDGISDILWQNSDGSAAIWLMNGTDLSSGSVVLNPGTNWTVNRVGDFNGDGKSDILLQHIDGRVSIWLMNGLSFISADIVLGPGTGWTVKQLGDFNGDGKSDILWQHSNGGVSLWLMDGLNFSGSLILEPGTGWNVQQIGDFNGDGKSDILWQHADGSTAEWLMNGWDLISGGSLLGSGTGWNVKAIGDFDADGKSDIVWQHTDGSVAVWIMNGLALNNGSGLIGSNTGWSVKAIADFNGDGRSDIVWQHVDGGSAVWLMNGTSLISGSGLLGPGTGWSPKHLGFYNADGNVDIIWQHIDGSVAIWLMNGLNPIGSAGLLGTGSGWAPVP